MGLNAQNISYPDSSVLAHGSWYAVNIPSNGIYKLAYADFVSLGVPEEEIDFDNLSIFGRSGKAISDKNSDYTQSDITENAIYVNAAGKYALFYAENTMTLTYDKVKACFDFKLHPYSDASTYFITFDAGIGNKKRISAREAVQAEATHQTSCVHDVFIHKREVANLLGSGRNWVGEALSSGSPELSIPLNLQNVSAEQNTDITIRVLNQAESPSSFDFKLNNGSIGSITVGTPPTDYVAYAGGKTFSVNMANDNNTLKIVFSGNATSKGRLDYVKVDYLRKLRYNNASLRFYATENIGKNNIVDYRINNVKASNVQIWEVRNGNVSLVEDYQKDGETIGVKVKADTLCNLIVFNGSNFPAPVLKGKVENQNLHAWEATDFVIVSAPAFLEQAERLAELHRRCDGMTVKVATTQQVYNEFSSGTKDFLAIRELMRMLYNRYAVTGSAPKNLLLFGDGTFDNKNILKYNNNFIPTYQAESSLVNTGFSFTTDDVLAYLSPYASGNIRDTMNIGVGRFTVNTLAEAKNMVDKCERYMNRTDIRNGEWGDWRNMVTLTADDADTWSERYFIENAENIYYEIKETNPDLNVEKIYSDAYKQYSSSAGATYPDASKAINQRMKKGCLLFNYVGHGSDDHLSSERLITITDISGWNNYNALPIFITSTCEFTRFDQVDKQSAGEFVLSSENGGGIALISASRKIPSRNEINKNLHKFAVIKENGKGLTFGEVFMKAKNATLLVVEERSFGLFGDPALRISLPQYNVKTTKINGFNTGLASLQDTVRALSNMTIEGEITDTDGVRIDDFNGKVQITLLDKASNYRTLDNEGLNTDIEFEQQKNILHKGSATVTNGRFAYHFMLPKDIAYNYGKGKISYYAQSDSTDAAGNYTDFIIGGIDTTVNIVESRPNVRLFINDTNFHNGGITDENPQLFAIISDSTAINTVGTGLGHDIMARLDNAANTFVLNDYFEPLGEDFSKGVIRFPFSNLAEGSHTLSIRVWNIFNFSSEAEVSFIVKSSKRGEQMKLKNYPNPFTESTEIILEHNQANSILSAELQIFDRTGRLIVQKDVTPYIGTYTVGPVQWDGNSDGGGQMGNGIFFVRMRLKTNADEIYTEPQKMVIFGRGK